MCGFVHQAEDLRSSPDTIPRQCNAETERNFAEDHTIQGHGEPTGAAKVQGI